MSRNIRQWWLPSLILMLAIILASLLLPNLIYPGNMQRDNQLPGAIPPTSTPTPAPTEENSIIDPATSSGRLETQVAPNTELPSVQNCTHTSYYWSTHPDAWLAENILIGRFSYSKNEAIQILKTENQEVTTDLLKQFFATLLNSLKGADTSSVDVTLVQASDWLGRHALGFEVSQADRQTGAALAQTLEDYNVGITGPGLCAGEPPTPTPGTTDTPTPTATPTSTLVPTRRPGTFVPAPSETPVKDKPTEEPAPPTEEPTEPAQTEPAPTEPPSTEPAPTEPPLTEPPPTDLPPPTPTEEPPLPTPTSPPLPTSAPTDIP